MINQNCHLVLRDLYYYDIVSAFPTIMDNQNYNFGDVDISNKTERNIFIGKEQIHNKNLSSFLNDSVKNLTDFYLQYNEIDDNDVIFRQKDGFIITKMLSINNLYIEMKLRHLLSLMIIDVKRECMIYYDEDCNMEVKGVKYYYPKLNDIYKLFLDLNFYDKHCLSLQLNNIKNLVVNSNDKLLFGINLDENEKQYTFLLKNGKQIKTFDLDFVDIEDIDRYKYFNFYFKPFLDSVFIEEFYSK